MCCHVVFIVFPVLRIHWTSYIYRFTVSIKFGNFQSFKKNLFFVSPSPSLETLVIDTLVCLKLSHSCCSLLLQSFSPVFHFQLFLLIWSSNSLIFSSAMSNLLLILSIVLSNSRILICSYCIFHCYFLIWWIFPWVLQHMGYSYLTLLMSLSTNPIICIISGLTLIDGFYSLWVFAYLENTEWMPDIENFSLLGVRYFCIPINIGELCSGIQVILGCLFR